MNEEKAPVIIRVEIDLTKERPLSLERMPVIRETEKIIWIEKKRARKSLSNQRKQAKETVEVPLPRKDIGAVNIINYGSMAVCYTGCRTDEDLQRVLQLRILEMMDRMNGRLHTMAKRLDRVEDDEIFVEGA